MLRLELKVVVVILVFFIIGYLDYNVDIKIFILVVDIFIIMVLEI